MTSYNVERLSTLWCHFPCEMGSTWAERVGWEEVGGFTWRVKTVACVWTWLYCSVSLGWPFMSFWTWNLLPCLVGPQSPRVQGPFFLARLGWHCPRDKFKVNLKLILSKVKFKLVDVVRVTCICWNYLWEQFWAQQPKGNLKWNEGRLKITSK